MITPEHLYELRSVIWFFVAILILALVISGYLCFRRNPEDNSDDLSQKIKKPIDFSEDQNDFK